MPTNNQKKTGSFRKLQRGILILGLFASLIMAFLVYGWKLFRDSYDGLRKSNGILNILLLGAGGEEGQVKDLTDAIMVLSLNYPEKTVSLISLPRDIWVEARRAKLNSIYHYAQEKNEGDGLSAAEGIISRLLEQPIHYGVLIDFNGLKGVVDALGGVSVSVENAFDDPKYPIAGKEKDMCNGDRELKCRYETLHFNAGLQTMDGVIALKYVRSRNAPGDEGTDFARERRQQILLRAIVNEIFSVGTISSVEKMKALVSIADSYLETDFLPKNIPGLAYLASRMKNSELRIYGLADLLKNPSTFGPYNYQWVLVPKSGNWDEIREYVGCIVETGEICGVKP